MSKDSNHFEAMGIDPKMLSDALDSFVHAEEAELPSGAMPKVFGFIMNDPMLSHKFLAHVLSTLKVVMDYNDALEAVTTSTQRRKASELMATMSSKKLPGAD